MDYSYYSNVNNYGEGSQQYHPEYTQYYSLWNSSQYYNTNELSPRNYFRNYRRDTGPPEKTPDSDADPADSSQCSKREADRDVPTTRTVTRFMLFEEPDFKIGTWNEPEISSDLLHTNAETGETSGYTTHFWLKAGQSHGFNDKDQRDSSIRKGKQNKFEKILLDKLSKPVKLSKAESMMQKMGWEGGALGKAGNGIVEPIAPNIAYATKTLGFGQIAETNGQKSPQIQQHKYTRSKAIPPKSKEDVKDDFITNSLLHILEFVKNDWEVQLLFDKKCTSKERKIIHQVVNGFINKDDDEIDDGIDINITLPAQQNLLDQIQVYNQFILCTESSGARSERQLCLYKLAPDHVYLITPDDLKDDPDEIEQDTKSNTKTDTKPNTKTDTKAITEPKEKTKEVIDLTDSDKETDNSKQDEADLKEDENPFLKSITRNLKSDKVKAVEENGKTVEDTPETPTKIEETNLNNENAIDAKLLDYFFEFAEQEEFTELRFLGPFNNEENVAISRLLGDIERCINHVVVERSKSFTNVFESEKFRYEVIDNCNGSSVVHKIEKCLQT